MNLNANGHILNPTGQVRDTNPLGSVRDNNPTARASFAAIQASFPYRITEIREIRLLEDGQARFVD